MNKELVLSSLDETKQLAEKIASFLIQENNFPISIHLAGDLGTGKTTLISSLVKSLPSIGKRSVLMAPTGRAAKVLSKYSNKKSSTIHKKIYWIKRNKKGKKVI